MKIAICDDDTVFLDTLTNLIKQEFERQGEPIDIVTAHDGDSLLKICAEEMPFAVFLDIVMPDIDGFEAAEKLRSLKDDIMLVFVSCNDSMYVSAYEYKPVWFVPKTDMKWIKKAIDKIIKRYREKISENELIPLTLSKQRIMLDRNSVQYFQSNGHYVNFYDDKGMRSPSYRGKLGAVEKELEEYRFVRTHNRYIVNLRMVVMLEKENLLLKSGARIPISRQQRQNVEKKFQEYYRSMR